MKIAARPAPATARVVLLPQRIARLDRHISSTSLGIAVHPDHPIPDMSWRSYDTPCGLRRTLWQKEGDVWKSTV